MTELEELKIKLELIQAKSRAILFEFLAKNPESIRLQLQAVEISSKIKELENASDQ